LQSAIVTTFWNHFYIDNKWAN